MKALGRQQRTSSEVDWNSMADLVWQGKTVPQACIELGYNWSETQKLMPVSVKGYMLDVSMLAGCREEYLNAE